MQDNLNQYNKDGYTIFRNVLDADLIAEASAHVDWLLERHPDTRPEQLHHHLMTKDAFWVRLIADDRLLNIAELFVGSDIALFASHYIAKRPGDGQAVLWHQDGSYWPLKPMKVVTLWLAVTDATTENGCMRVIPGTHTGPAIPESEYEQVLDGKNVLGSGLPKRYVQAASAVDCELRAGDVSVHHPNVIHGSNANLSTDWRRGLTIRYIPATTRILVDEQPFPSAFLLRGNAAENGNVYNPLPESTADFSMPFRNQDRWNRHCRQQNLETSSG